MKEDSHREKGLPSLEEEVVPTREAAGRSLLVEEAVLPMMAAADRILPVEEVVLPTIEEVLPTLPVALVVEDSPAVVVLVAEEADPTLLVVEAVVPTLPVVLVVEDNRFAADLVAGDNLRFEEEAAWALLFLLGAGFVVLVVEDSPAVVVLVVGDSHSAAALVVEDNLVVDIRPVVLAEEDTRLVVAVWPALAEDSPVDIRLVVPVVDSSCRCCASPSFFLSFRSRHANFVYFSVDKRLFKIQNATPRGFSLFTPLAASQHSTSVHEGKEQMAYPKISPHALDVWLYILYWY